MLTLNIDLLPTFSKIQLVIKVGDKVGGKAIATRKHGLNSTRERILSEMRHNPNITKAELVVLIGISDTAIDNNIRYLRNNGFIKRIGENKNGYWEVVKRI